MKDVLLGLNVIGVMTCVGCGLFPNSRDWKDPVNQQVNQLGYGNWIVVAEASFPAHSRIGARQVISDAEVPEVIDYVLKSLEQNQYLRPELYVTREMRSLENDFAPGIDYTRERIRESLHGHETTEIDQQSIITLLESANKSYDVLVIRTTTALPYTSVFIDLQPGYWDAQSEDRLRQRINRERLERLARPYP